MREAGREFAQASFTPFFYPAREYLRPWKLLSLACGLALLVMGAVLADLPDWDIPISIIMAVPTYFAAPCTLESIFQRRWRNLPAAALWTWLSVDGTYAAYWWANDPRVLEQLRPANAAASLALYGTCGIVWLHRGNLGELVPLLRTRLSRVSRPYRP